MFSFHHSFYFFCLLLPKVSTFLILIFAFEVLKILDISSNQCSGNKQQIGHNGYMIYSPSSSSSSHIYYSRRIA